MYRKVRRTLSRIRLAAALTFPRFGYAIFLFVIALATLEGLKDLVHDLTGLRLKAFHYAALILAAFLACLETFTCFTVDLLRDLLRREDHIVLPPPGSSRNYTYRVAFLDDIPKISDLAKSRYGRWAFPLSKLQDWFNKNENCFFVITYNGHLVGYIDAFPIASTDFDLLVDGGSERKLTPQAPSEITSDSSFYIASYVLREGFEAKAAALIRRGLSGYMKCYPVHPWNRICAEGFTPRGERLLRGLGFLRSPVALKEIYVIEPEMLPRMSESLRKMWSRILPPRTPHI